MESNPKKILDDINKKISQRQIFSYNRESLIQGLLLAYNDIMRASVTINPMIIDHFIEQYRTVLKFIFSVDNINGPIPKSMDDIVSEFVNIILEFSEKYNHIRNYLDQSILGTREMRLDEMQSLYYEENYDNSSNYARMLDKVKEFPSEEIKYELVNRIRSYLCTKKYKVNVLKDTFFNSLMDDYEKLCWMDSEIKFDYVFKDFKYSEIIKFCAGLKLIADVHYCLSFVNGDYSKIKKESLIYRLSKLTDLPKEKIIIFLKYQTYDYEYQKDKITLIQGLIEINDSYYFCPITINLGLLPVKMFRLLVDYDKKTLNPDFSRIAKKKEVQMTNEICSLFEKNYDVSITTNYKIKDHKKDLAEYDMLILDNKTNNLYICEFKWFFVGDGEKEHILLNNKLKDSIQHRIEKDKFIIDNPQKVSNELFESKKINKIYELLISQNYPGNTDNEMCVIDFETLEWSARRHDSLEELMNYFLSRDFKESIPIANKLADFDYEGYKFRFYIMCPK